MSSILVYISKILVSVRLLIKKRYCIGERTVRNLDDSTIIAIMSINGLKNRQNGIWTIKGKIETLRNNKY